MLKRRVAEAWQIFTTRAYAQCLHDHFRPSSRWARREILRSLIEDNCAEDH